MQPKLLPEGEAPASAAPLEPPSETLPLEPPRTPPAPSPTEAPLTPAPAPEVARSASPPLAEPLLMQPLQQQEQPGPIPPSNDTDTPPGLSDGPLFAALRRDPQAQQLVLSFRSLTGCPSMPPLSQLRRLDLSHNALTGLPRLAELAPRLQCLNVGFNALADLTFIQGCGALKELWVCSNKLSGAWNEVCAALSTAPALQAVVLHCNPCLEALAGVPVQEPPPFLQRGTGTLRRAHSTSSRQQPGNNNNAATASGRASSVRARLDEALTAAASLDATAGEVDLSQPPQGLETSGGGTFEETQAAGATTMVALSSTGKAPSPSSSRAPADPLEAAAMHLVAACGGAGSALQRIVLRDPVAVMEAGGRFHREKGVCRPLADGGAGRCATATAAAVAPAVAAFIPTLCATAAAWASSPAGQSWLARASVAAAAPTDSRKGAGEAGTPAPAAATAPRTAQEVAQRMKKYAGEVAAVRAAKAARAAAAGSGIYGGAARASSAGDFFVSAPVLLPSSNRESLTAAALSRAAAAAAALESVKGSGGEGSAPSGDAQDSATAVAAGVADTTDAGAAAAVDPPDEDSPMSLAEQLASLPPRPKNAAGGGRAAAARGVAATPGEASTVSAAPAPAPPPPTGRGSLLAAVASSLPDLSSLTATKRLVSRNPGSTAIAALATQAAADAVTGSSGATGATSPRSPSRARGGGGNTVSNDAGLALPSPALLAAPALAAAAPVPAEAADRAVRRDADMRRIANLMERCSAGNSSATLLPTRVALEVCSASSSSSSHQLFDWAAVEPDARVSFAGRSHSGVEGVGAVAAADTNGDGALIAARYRSDGGLNMSWPNGAAALQIAADDRVPDAIARYNAAAVRVGKPLCDIGAGAVVWRVSAYSRELGGKGKGLSVAFDGLGVGCVSSNTGATLLSLAEDGGGFLCDESGGILRRWDGAGRALHVSAGYKECRCLSDVLAARGHGGGTGGAGGVAVATPAAGGRGGWLDVAAGGPASPRRKGGGALVGSAPPSSPPPALPSPELHPSIKSARAMVAAALAAAEASNAALQTLLARSKGSSGVGSGEGAAEDAAATHSPAPPAAPPARSLASTPLLNEDAGAVRLAMLQLLFPSEASDTASLRQAAGALVVPATPDTDPASVTGLSHKTETQCVIAPGRVGYALGASLAVVIDLSTRVTHLVLAVKGLRAKVSVACTAPAH